MCFIKRNVRCKSMEDKKKYKEIVNKMSKIKRRIPKYKGIYRKKRNGKLY